MAREGQKDVGIEPRQPKRILQYTFKSTREVVLEGWFFGLFVFLATERFTNTVMIVLNNVARRAVEKMNFVSDDREACRSAERRADGGTALLWQQLVKLKLEFDFGNDVPPNDFDFVL